MGLLNGYNLYYRKNILVKLIAGGVRLHGARTFCCSVEAGNSGSIHVAVFFVEKRGGLQQGRLPDIPDIHSPMFQGSLFQHGLNPFKDPTLHGRKVFVVGLYFGEIGKTTPEENPMTQRIMLRSPG